MFLKETLPFSHFCFTSPAGWPRSLCGAGHYFASAVVPPTLCCGSLSCSRWRKETRGAVRSRCSGWVAEWYCARNGSGVGGRVCLRASDGGVRVTVIFVCVELQPEAASREVQESVEHCEEPGRCALLGGASGALPSPPSLAYRTTVDPGPLSSAWAAGRSGVFAGFLAVEEAAAALAATAMAVERRPELVGKRFLCVEVGEEARPERGESGRCRRGWRAGVIRAVSHRDSRDPDLAVRARPPIGLLPHACIPALL